MSNVDLVRGVYEAFAKGDVQAVLGALDFQVDWTESEGFPYAGKYIGTQEVLNRVFVPLATEWEGYKAEPEQFLDAGDTVVALGWYSGTYRKTGRPFRARFAHVFWIASGKVWRFQQYTDTALVREAMK